VHFVWQGAALALIAVLLLLCLKRARAAVRYLALLAVLATMAAAPVLTFVNLVSPEAQLPPAMMAAPPAARTVTGRPALRPSLTAGGAAQQAQGPPAETTVPALRVVSARALAVWRWVKLNASLLALAWAAGVLLLCLRLAWRWAAVSRARRRAAPLGESYSELMLSSLVKRLRVRQAVELLRSASVYAPSVVGWLRPAILLPAGVLTGLTPEQLEAVLAHELAHIRRYDYLVNIVQSVIEVLLFYHPAVWWVSHRIRVEREHCCDDVAVGACGSVVTYTRALTELERLRTPLLELVVAASGTPLVSRIRRLVVPPDRRGVVPSWVTAIAPLLAVGALVAGQQFAGPDAVAAPPGPGALGSRSFAAIGHQPASLSAGFPVCTALGDQVHADISGDVVVWTDYRREPNRQRKEAEPSKYSDIYGYNIQTGREFPVCTAPGEQTRPRIDGNIVVWADYRNDPDGQESRGQIDNPDVYGYDLASGKELPICVSEGYENDPAISGDLVVWVDARGAVTGMDIWGCNLSDGRVFSICTAPGDQLRPSASGTVVVWQDLRNDAATDATSRQWTNWDVYGIDLASGPEMAICANPFDQEYPRASGRIVTWHDFRSDPQRTLAGEGTGGADVYAYDLDQKREFSVATELGAQCSPAISGNRIVYLDMRIGISEGLVIYDFSTGTRVSLPRGAPFHIDYPAISGDTVVWEVVHDPAKTGVDIYGCRLPERAIAE
jgi:beta propeller repeat protein